MSDRINGSFRKRPGFAMASNAAIRCKSISLKAKGLYTLIMSYIRMPNFTLTKSFLLNHCLEKDRAFNSAWDELKTTGFLKVHFSPGGRSGQWNVEYDLLEEASIDDGVHTYYYNSAGIVTGTNLTRHARRASCPVASSKAPDDRSIQNVGNGDHTLHYRTYGEHSNGNRTDGEHTNVSVDNIIIPSNNTFLNTINHQTFSHTTQDGMDDKMQTEQIISEMNNQKMIPLSFSADRKKMRIIIHYLSNWEDRQKNPYTTCRGHVDEMRMNAFNFCVDCLIDMSCTQSPLSIQGISVTNRNVIDEINRVSCQCSKNGLWDFLEVVVDDFMKACESTQIHDIRKYTMSIIWNCFITYKIKQDLEYISNIK